jgi:hypothetical protein
MKNSKIFRRGRFREMRRSTVTGFAS